MRALADMAAPLLILAVLAAGTWQGLDLYGLLLGGVRKGLSLMAELLPTLLLLFPAIYLLRESGLTERLGTALSPVLAWLGVPEETVPLMLLRPLSGSAALAVTGELLERCGPESLAGRTAAVMLGSSETSFYVLAVYFSAAGVKGSRWALPAALAADLACFLSAAWASRLLWG